jgi:putative Mn2+ efflux pump MntP
MKICGGVAVFFLELLVLALALSMDAFAVSVCRGLCMRRWSIKRALVIGVYFGFFQAVMPLIGFLAGQLFADAIASFDHWVTFALLGFIGAKMIRESRAKTDASCDDEEPNLSVKVMLPLALATSVDALAAGITLAFQRVDIIPAVALIGVTTLILSAAGTKIGQLFGARLKSRAELLGGVILILMGLRILLEHAGVFG